MVVDRYKAAFYAGNRRFQIRQVQPSALARDSVLIRVHRAGICGGDLAVYRRRRAKDDFVCGHEFCGEVAGIGEDVRGIELGSRVIVVPRLACGQCPACQMGLYTCCYNLLSIGVNANGAFAEYVEVPVDTVCHLPGSLSWEEGALVEPLAVSLHAVSLADLQDAEYVAIVGAGTIGFLVLLAVKAIRKCQTVVYAKYEHQALKAEQLGADFVIRSWERTVEQLGQDIIQMTGGKGVSIAIEAAGGERSPLQEWLPVVRRCGRVILIGRRSAGSFDSVVARELTVIGSHLYTVPVRGQKTNLRKEVSDEFQKAIGLVESKRIDLQKASLVTHIFPLDQIDKAFEIAADKNTGCIKVQIAPWLTEQK